MNEKTINLYQTSSENLLKTCCLLLSKCYEDNSRTLAITKDSQTAILLDNMLWSFSQKSFIPHALYSDPLYEEHPIIISHSQVENNMADFSTIMLIESFQSIDIYNKIILGFSTPVKQEGLQFRSSHKSNKSNYYVQDAKGPWSSAE